MNNSNKYGSLVDSFAAPDMYNLAMPVTPPTDLNLTTVAFANTYLSFRNSTTSRVVDFNPNDNPYIRGLALTSNLADGLVDASSAHYGGSISWQCVLRPHRVSAALSGTINNVVGTATITGGGAAKFTQELVVGATLVWIDDQQVQRDGTILTITDDNTLTLNANTLSAGMFIAGTSYKKGYILVGQDGYAGDAISIPFLQMNNMYPFAFFAARASLIYTPRGKITLTAGSTAVTGVGTKFLTDIVQNGNAGLGYIIGWVDDLGFRRTARVATVNSDTLLQVTANIPAGYTGTNVSFVDLDNALRLQALIPFGIFAYTISISPSFAGKRLSFGVMAEIEHSFVMSGSLT